MKAKEIQYIDPNLFASKNAWDALSMREKAEMMRVAVRNGITNLQEIRQEFNEFAEGGGIHIKPENHGKFTALKERTGHSATWFKEHGTPSQKKMATFALNARHWKHGLGGTLFDGLSNNTNQMQIGLNVTNGWRPYTLDEIVANGARIEAQRQAIEDAVRESQIESNDNLWVETPLTYRKKNAHLTRKAEEGAKAHAAWEKEHPNLTAWGNVLGAAPFAVAAYPLASTIGSGVAALGDAAAATTAGQGLTNFLAPVATSTIAGAPAMEWANAGLTSMFGAHGIQSAVDEGGISPMTALEIAPMLQVAKPMVNEAALAVENYRYPLGRPQVPEGYLTIKPQTRTRVGDVEIDNPNLLYHLDRGDGQGAFSNQGAYVADGLLFPGTPKDASAVPYSWWNKGKPYATHVGEQPMTRLMTATEDSPGMTHIRSQNYPIGQWNGQRGFVLNSEYVNPKGVDVSGSTFNWESGYGWRRATIPAYTAPFEEPANVTDRFLRLVGNTNEVGRAERLSSALEKYKTLSPEKRAEIMAQERMLRNAGVDMSQIDAADIMEANEKWNALISNTPFGRHSTVKPVGINGYEVFDSYKTPQGIKDVGKMDLYGKDTDNSLHIGYISNKTRFEDNPFGGVQERGVNSAVMTANSLGMDGVISGEQYLNAPLQLHVMDKFPKKVILKGRGKYNNTKAVEDYRKKHGIRASIFEEDRHVNTVEEMRNADPNVRTYLEPADAFLLKEPNGFVSTKGTIFNPIRIDNQGKNAGLTSKRKVICGYIKR